MTRKPIKYALRWCRTCQNPVAAGNRCRCPQPYGHVPILLREVLLGERVQCGPYAHLYGCVVGDGTRIGAFVEIQRGVVIGTNCKIGTHSFVCTGVKLEDGVFIGHGVYFCNDRWPRAVQSDGMVVGEGDWKLEGTTVQRRASIGTGSIILPGITIGADAMIGAGTIVTRDVPDGAIVRSIVTYVIKERAS